eukprot:gene2593-3130_t
MKQQSRVLNNYTMTGSQAVIGFFYGGAGFILGKGVLDVLRQNKVQNVMLLDDETQRYFQHLSVSKELLRLDALHCRPGTCVLTETTEEDESLAVSVRLVDLCARLMSGEHTCHHSDHAFTRCLIYGAFAKIISMPQRRYNMIAASYRCDLKWHFTCFHFKPMSSNDLRPVLLSTEMCMLKCLTLGESDLKSYDIADASRKLTSAEVDYRATRLQ